MAFLDLIENHEFVTDVYGQWPAFAGAYILSTQIEAAAYDFYDLGERQLNLTLHWWLDAPDHYPDAPRHYERADLHRRICLAFMVEDVRIRTFHCSNSSIDSLVLERRGDCLDIKCEGGYQLEATAWGAKVLSVAECSVTGELTEAQRDPNA